MRNNPPTIAIAGAGIAGLTAALTLAQCGFHILVFERSDGIRTSGTGIQISPNAFKVFDGFDAGLGETLLRNGFVPDAIDMRSGLTGEHLTQFPLGQSAVERYGAPYVVMHRYDLSHALKAACDAQGNIAFHFGHTVSAFDAREEGVILHTTSDGVMQEHRADAAIGADGAWSVLRSFVPDASLPTFTGRIAWRMVMDMASAPADLSRQSTGLWLGPDAHLVHYPIRNGREMNVVAITPWQHKDPPPKTWLSEPDLQDRVAAFDGWHETAQSLLHQDAYWGGWPLHAISRAGPMAKGPLCLIGDAAHAVVPFGAQGGASGIEDAAILAQSCAASPDDLPSAFRAFQTRRTGRIQQIIALSDNNRRIYHMGRLTGFARNTVMRHTPARLMQKRMDWLYGWDGLSKN